MLVRIRGLRMEEYEVFRTRLMAAPLSKPIWAERQRRLIVIVFMYLFASSA